jgi:hypothetical protein
MRETENVHIYPEEKQAMGDIITSSVRGEQPSQLSSIMPPHSTSRLQLMPPTQNSSSSTALVQMRANRIVEMVALHEQNL